MDELAKEIRHNSVLLELALDKVQLLAESVGAMQDDVKHIPKMREDIAELKGDTKIIKAAVTDTSKDVHRLDRRMDTLEARA